MGRDEILSLAISTSSCATTPHKTKRLFFFLCPLFTHTHIHNAHAHRGGVTQPGPPTSPPVKKGDTKTRTHTHTSPPPHTHTPSLSQTVPNPFPFPWAARILNPSSSLPPTIALPNPTAFSMGPKNEDPAAATASLLKSTRGWEAEGPTRPRAGEALPGETPPAAGATFSPPPRFGRGDREAARVRGEVVVRRDEAGPGAAGTGAVAGGAVATP